MFINDIPLYLKELNLVSIIVRLSMAVIFGGIIGFGREVEKRPAGLRTHILVSIGATLAMITNIYVSKNYGGNIDPTRIGAQVISGIGFLGAGTILVTGKNKVKGLTTAAGLWASACMGLAIGVGFYEGAIIGCIFIYAVTAILGKVDRRINNNSRNISLYIIINSPVVFENVLRRIQLEGDGIKIRDVDISNYNLNCNELIGVLITLRIPEPLPHNHIINSLRNELGVIFLQEVQ